MSIEDKPRSGRPSTSRTDENVEKIRELVLTDRRQTIEELSESSGLTWSSVQRKVRQKRRDLWQTGDWFFHHDNAPTHTAISESQDTDSLPHINLIICIIGRYFRQEDLADPYV
ncbi:hypothetical protein J6590_028908 [Homalodisca vitripennis]|nr:hypothetical protein J6590_028908 [Homalodisca vitripennis]